MTEDNRWLTTDEVLKSYPFGRTRLYDALLRGTLKSSRWGRRYLVKRADIERWLDENRHNPGDA